MSTFCVSLMVVQSAATTMTAPSSSLSFLFFVPVRQDVIRTFGCRDASERYRRWVYSFTNP